MNCVWIKWYVNMVKADMTKYCNDYTHGPYRAFTCTKLLGFLFLCITLRNNMSWFKGKSVISQIKTIMYHSMYSLMLNFILRYEIVEYNNCIQISLIHVDVVEPYYTVLKNIALHGYKSKLWNVIVMTPNEALFKHKIYHDDVIKWKHFPRYWPFVWESTGHRWILLTKASDAELWCFRWSAPE